MRIGSNAVGFLRGSAFERTSQAIARSLERLSTGQRVHSPTEDVVGLATSIRMDAQVRGLRQGVQNLAEGTALVTTAASAVESQIDLVYQMRELALAASQSTLSGAEREDINKELKQLLSEYSRITNETSYNGRNLLNGDSQNLEIATGFGSDNVSLTLESSLASDTFARTVGSGNFLSRQSTAAGGDNNYGMVTADFNRDGHLDLATTDSGANQVRISLGDGSGSFAGGITSATSVYTGLLRSGDFNGDGIEDLVTLQWHTGDVSVLIGQGDGTFSEDTAFVAIGRVHDISTGDFDRDGKDDIFLAAYGNDSEILSDFNGSSFAGYETLAFTGNLLNSSDVGDFNSDGYLDIIGNDESAAENRIFFNDGEGNFTTEYSEIADDTGHGLRTGDFNNDGKLDFVQTLTGISQANVYINNGNGTSFTKSDNLNFDMLSFNHVEVADLNDDGNLDVVVLGLTPTIFLGVGNGTFGVGHALSATGTAMEAGIGDFNEDGALDIAASDDSGTQSLIYLARTTARYRAGEIDVSSEESADVLLDILDAALTRLQEHQSQLTALHSKLDIESSRSMLMGEVMTEAKQNLLSIDYAMETAELVRLQILQQSQVAIRAQANVQMQMVLQLLEIG